MTKATPDSLFFHEYYTIRAIRDLQFCRHDGTIIDVKAGDEYTVHGESDDIEDFEEADRLYEEDDAFIVYRPGWNGYTYEGIEYDCYGIDDEDTESEGQTNE